MSAKPQRYVIAAMYKQSAETIASMGFDKAAIYADAGIDLDRIEPEHRLDPLQWSERLWDAFLSRVPADEVSYRIMERFNMGVFGVAGYVIVNSPSFIKAFENFVRYTHLHTNQYDLYLTQDGNVNLHFDRTTEMMNCDRFNVEMYVLGFTYNILKLIPGSQFPLEVHYEFGPPKDTAPRDALFGNNTRFFYNMKQNKMVYDGKLTNVRLLNPNEQLYEMFDRMATESLHKLKDEGTLTSTVKQTLAKRLKGYLPTIEEMAEELNMSSRNLQLKLKNEGTSYRELTEEVRKDIATTHLKAGQLNIGEIAFLLGFNEISSFSSAFKKWTGKSPSAFV
jgi:AraC-like DNA-binding protein